MRRFIPTLLLLITAVPCSAQQRERTYENRLVRIADPQPLLADYPEFVEPVRETFRYEAPLLVDDEQADLEVRAWRFSYNARGIIEMPNRLRASQAAVIMVHPWGIDDGQGWNTLDARKPKQVNLRKAVSSGYYAVFHYLIHEACRIQIGAQHTQAPYRRVLGRAFTHITMKQACASFGGGTLKASVAKGLPTSAAGAYIIPPEIRRLAAMFVDLQDRRHLADYDLTERFIRSDVLTLIEQAKQHVAAFAQLPASDDKRFFLACLWAWKELASR